MILQKIEIENFRSISSLSFKVEEVDGMKCHIFFGINETGKSNILKAISMIESESLDYYRDCEKSASKKKEEVSISYSYDIPDDSFASEHIQALALPDELKKQITICGAKKRISCNADGEQSNNYWLYFSGIDYSQFQINKTDKSIIYGSPSPDEKDQYEQLNEQNLDGKIYEELTPLLEGKRPKVIYWEPKEAYLITEPVNLSTFVADPTTSIPLRNIFALAGYKEETLTNTIARAFEDDEERAELEDIISDKVTSHINKLWPEHKVNIKIRIEKDKLCRVSVEDQDNTKPKFRMTQRSDGFKHFISLLLTLSAESATDQLVNCVILLDEPERSLHPSSVRYLRDELLNISKNNIVLVASHSIYMVDKKNLDRHYTVRKEKGFTHVERVQADNPLEEEVIYEALGTSIYEIIEPNVIIVEGRIDKEILNAFLIKLKTKVKPPPFQIIGATGTHQIPKYAKFFNQKFINGFVVVDSDGAGRSAIKEVIAENNVFDKRALEINNLVASGKKEAELEDLLPRDIVLSVASDLYGHAFQLPEIDQPILQQIRKHKSENKIREDAKLEDLKVKILQNVLRNIKKLTIAQTKERYPLYCEFVTKLSEKLKGN